MRKRIPVEQKLSAIKDRGIEPMDLINRSDNGSQYISSIYEAYCGLRGIYHEFTHARCPEENGHAEAYHGFLNQKF